MKPLEITQSMREQSRTEIDERIERINNSIRRAVEWGQTTACFNINRDDPHYHTVREAFEQSGYHIAPTGYIGGVWQTTENISW